MAQNINNFLKKTKIDSELGMIALLEKHQNQFNLSECEFKLSINLYEIIRKHPIAGIEITAEINREKDATIISANITPGCYVTNLKFTKPVNLANCVFNGPVNFENVIFEKGLQFHRNILNDWLSFSHVHIRGEAAFSGTHAKNKFTLSQCVLLLSKPGFKYSNFEGDFFSYNCHYPTGLDMGLCRFNTKLELMTGKIDGLLDLSDSKIKHFNLTGTFRGEERIAVNDFLFYDCQFSEQVLFNSIDFNGQVNGVRASFEKPLFIDKCTFNNTARFAGITFNAAVSLENCVVENHLSFSYATFHKNLSIKKTRLGKASVWFTGARINDDLWIGGGFEEEPTVTMTGTLSFQGAVISSNSIVRIIGINKAAEPAGKLQFHNALIKGLVDIRNVYISEVNFDGTVVTGNIQDNHTMIGAIKDRNTARLLKNEAKKINNTIFALAYYRREVALHARTLRLKNIDDYLLLKLNSWSNNYGTSWLKGLFFTFSTAFICYGAFTLIVKGIPAAGLFFCKEWFWAGLINYVWLPSGLEGLISNNKIIGGGFGATIFITGKILIAYGIFQTITAFRKYL